MKKLIYSIVFISTWFAEARAQILERQVIGSSGYFQVASWGSLSYTTGEAMTNTLFGTSSLVLTQGFQQPQQVDLAAPSIYFSTPAIEIYPNPADDKINIIVIAGNLNRQYTVGLYDLLGQKINAPSEINGIDKNLSITLYLQLLAPASYFIVVSDAHYIIETFKFTKTR